MFKHIFILPLRNPRIFFIPCQYLELGELIYWLRILIVNAITWLVLVKYCSTPMAFLYSERLYIGSSSVIRCFPRTMGIRQVDALSLLNFLSISQCFDVFIPFYIFLIYCFVIFLIYYFIIIGVPLRYPWLFLRLKPFTMHFFN